MIVNRHVGTQSPHNGLGPNVLNVPAQWDGFPKASASNVVWTTANYLTSAVNSMGYSAAPTTQPDYARNICVKLVPNSGSAGLYSAGSVIIYGRDVFGSSRSEAFAVTGAIGSASAPTYGSVNFANVDTVSFRGVVFHTASSSARSDVSFYVGVGQKVGLPVPLVSADAVYQVVQGTSRMSTYTASGSTSGNQFTAVTGDYYVNGVSLSAVHNSASNLRVEYKNLGWMAPYGSY
jgi:hypothetical protein